MAEEKRSTANLVQRVSANSADRIVVLSDPSGNATTATISIGDLFGNSSLNIIANSIAIGTGTPANSSAMIVRAGTLIYDANYLYVATANNLVKRIGTLSIF